MSQLLPLWFGLDARVTRRAYVATGVSLMALKVVVDELLMLAATGKPWPLGAYLLPSLILKNEALGPQPGWVLAAMAATALPFLWVGVTMSVRRAADAGLSPWLGTVFFVPLLNYVTMIVLAVLPSAPADRARWQPAGPYREGVGTPKQRAADVGDAVRGALIGVLASTGFGLGMIALSVYVFRLYGAALFFATPFLMGTTSALLYNRRGRRSIGYTILVALGSVTMTGSAMLLFGVEGVLCLAMAFPIAATLACLGAILGWAAMTHAAPPRPSALALVLLLPPSAVGIERSVARPELREVTTFVEIDAPPDVVWQHTIGFSELPPPPEWFFRLGVAYPMRARIDGEGVGAVRRCEFSTGAFVEPITTWDPGKKLAFDVARQPPSMTELSPYRHVNAPHLEGYMVSRRGEFRFVALPNGRTRLEGSTFYTLSLFPESYWAVWGEQLLHAIHGRVLGHIKQLSEQGR